MEIRFVAPDLRQLDLSGTEVLALGVAQGERPPHGVAGLVDWRLAGRVSALIQQGYLRGVVGEALLIPGRPKLPFDKIVLFGIGELKTFNEQVYRAVLRRILTTLEGLKARTAVVELPGRHANVLPADRAVELLLEQAAGRSEHDLWTLVEPQASQRSISRVLLHERRRSSPREHD